jgi:hypothetical protein
MLDDIDEFSITEPADEEGNRNLTLISKIIMSLANLTSFDVKDNYLSEHTAAFFDENIPKMRQYLDTVAVSISDGTDPMRI